MKVSTKRNAKNKQEGSSQNLMDLLVITVAVASISAFPFALDAFTFPKLLVLSIGILITLLLALKSKKFEFYGIKSFEIFLVLMCFFGLIISTISSKIPSERALLGQYGRGNGLIYFALVLLVLVLAKNLWLNSASLNLIRILGYFSWLIAVYAILQSVGIDIAELDTTKSKILLTLGNSNFSGGLLSVFFTFNLMVLVKSKTGLFRRSILVGSLFYATILTGAIQGVLICIFAVLLAINILLKEKFPRLFKNTLFLQFVCLICLVLLTLIQKGPLWQVLNRPTLKIRFEYWQIGLKMLRDHPWFGVGPDNFYDFSPIYMSPGSLELVTLTRLDAAHNWYINLAANYGLISALPMCILMIWVVIRNLKVYLSKKPLPDLFLAVSVTFVALLIDGFFSIEQPGLGVWLYLFCGINLSMLAVIENKTLKSYASESKIVQLFLLAFLGIALLSTAFVGKRVYNDIQYRNVLKIISTEGINQITQKELLTKTLALRSEPEYVSKSINLFAESGNGVALDLVTKSALEYNSYSLQGLLMRQEILRALGRKSEACVIQEKLIPIQPWELVLWKNYLSCQNLDAQNGEIVRLASFTEPFVKVALKNESQKSLQKAVELNTLASYTAFYLGKKEESLKYLSLAIENRDSWNLSNSQKPIGLQVNLDPVILDLISNLSLRG